jgi:hypothetical protein
MQTFLLGAIAMGSAIACLLFLRFWRAGNDRLFLFFAASFGIEAINRTMYALTLSHSNEYELGYYLARLVSFLLILAAIIDKNSARKRG